MYLRNTIFLRIFPYLLMFVLILFVFGPRQFVAGQNPCAECQHPGSPNPLNSKELGFSVSKTKYEFWSVKGTPSLPQPLTLSLRDDLKVHFGGFILRNGVLLQEASMCSLTSGGAKDLTPFKLTPDPVPALNPSVTLQLTYTPTTDSDVSKFLCIPGIWSEENFRCTCDGPQIIEVIGHTVKEPPAILLVEPKGGIMFSVNQSDPFRLPIQRITVEITGNNEIEIEITDVKFVDPTTGVEISPGFNAFVGTPSTARSLIGQKVKAGSPLFFQLSPITQFGTFPPEHTLLRISAKSDAFGPMTSSFPITFNVIPENPFPEPMLMPTLQEWGMTTMALLLAALGVIFIMRGPAKAELSVGGPNNKYNHSMRMIIFAPRLFGKALAGVLVLVLVVTVVLIRLFGQISATDVCGALLCSLILAYILHLLIIAAKNLNDLY